VVLHLAGHGVTVSPALRRRIEAKIAKVQRILPRLIEARVVLATERYRHLVEVTLLAKGRPFHVEGAASSFPAALDQALAHLEAQVRRRKERVVGHKKTARPRRPLAAAPGPDAPAERSDQRRTASPGPRTPPAPPAPPQLVVRQTNAKPMSLEEAVDQLRLRNDGLLVFRNARTRVVNVLRRRSDGTVELVEPAG
jgi:putative sigma-54 modulation protein